MSEWISVDDKLPPYGDPVIIFGSGVVQNVTYMLDGWDDTPDWFEPFHFDHGDDNKVRWDKITHWMPLPEPPK